MQVRDLSWVSVAKEDELTKVMFVFRTLLDESEYKKYVPDNVEEVIKGLIKNETLLCLRTETGDIVGLLAFTIYDNPHILFKKRFAQELVWCVLKPYRKDSKLLVKHYELVAEAMGCTSVMLSAMVSDKSPMIGRMYQSMGYRRSEEFFEKELI